MSRTPTKPRIDAWDATLTEEQRWRAYTQLRRSTWYELAQWLQAEYGIPPPSRSAIYRWARRMRSQESAHRLDQALIARAEIGALAGTTATNDKLISAYKSMAADLALQGNAQEAIRLTTMAMSLAAQQTAQAELALKERGQELRQREVAIKEATTREMAIDQLLKEAADNDQAKDLLRQFLEALDN